MKDHQKAGTKVFFENLDGLRFIAFLLVFFSHAITMSAPNLRIKGTFMERILSVIASGNTGVSIFFVLSGFLITYLILTEVKIQGKVNVPFFYVRRILRIWPLYYIVVTFALLFYPTIRTTLGKSNTLPHNPILYFTFLSNFDVINTIKSAQGSVSTFEGITWSVAVEEQFYLLWPLLFFYLPKRLYLFVFPSFVIASLLFRTLKVTDDMSLYYHSLSVCGDLAVGGICAYFAMFYYRFKYFFVSLSKVSILSTYLIGTTYLMYGGIFSGSSIYVIFSRLIGTLFFAFIILEQNYSIHSFYKFSHSNFLTFWGKYTYGLYLLHPITLFILEICLKKLRLLGEPNLLLTLSVIIIGLSLSLAMSYLSYEVYERKFLNLKKKFSFINTSDATSNNPQATKQVRIVKQNT